MAFLALIYGMYLKISKSPNILSKSLDNFSLNLKKEEKIKNMEVIDNENILILIDYKGKIKGYVYNYRKNQIIRFINR